MRTFLRRRGNSDDIRRIGLMDDEGRVVIERGILGETLKKSYTHGLPIGSKYGGIQHATEIMRRWLNNGFVEKREEEDVHSIWNRLPVDFTLFEPSSIAEAHDTSLVIMSPHLRGGVLGFLTVNDIGGLNLWSPSRSGVICVTERMPYLAKYAGMIGIPNQSVFVVDYAFQRPGNERDEDTMTDILWGDSDKARRLQQPGLGKVIMQLQIPLFMMGRREVDHHCSEWLSGMVDRFYDVCAENPAVNVPTTITTTVEQAVKQSERWRCSAYLYAPDMRIGGEAFTVDGGSCQLDGTWNVQELDWEN